MGSVAGRVANVRPAMTQTLDEAQVDLFGEVLWPDPTPAATCTRDTQCKAGADAHEADCPVEVELRETFGF
jgi:hypothetical protein